MKKRALLLFSGGLDSILAVKILEKAGLSVTGITFSSYFFDDKEAEKSARQNKIKLVKKNFSKKHLEIVKNPRYGSGGGMNPCVDCHGLMLKEAEKYLKKNKFDILATGEVLGQRPFSQHRQAFLNIEKLIGLEGKILRPLSGKILPETIYEKRGWINREKLENIQGRSRKKQIALAKKFGIKKYPTPAGGCILTEKEYSKKLEKLLDFKKNLENQDFKLLRIGRHFWIDNCHIILGKDKEENHLIEKIKRKGVLIKPNYDKGPSAFIEGENINDEIIKKVTEMIWERSSDDKIKKFDSGNYEILKVYELLKLSQKEREDSRLLYKKNRKAQVGDTGPTCNIFSNDE